MKAATLLRSPVLLLQVVLLSLMLGGPVASCVTAVSSAAWWAIALAPVVFLLVALDARRLEPARVRSSSPHRRKSWGDKIPLRSGRGLAAAIAKV